MASLFKGKCNTYFTSFKLGLVEILEKTRGNDNESLAIALNVCMQWRNGEDLSALGSCGVIVGCGGESGSQGDVPIDQLSTQENSLSTVIWMNPSEGSDENFQTLLSEIRRILRPDGFLVVAEGGRNEHDDSEDSDIIVADRNPIVIAKTSPIELLECSAVVNQSAAFDVLRRYHTYSGYAWAFIGSSVGASPPFPSLSIPVLAESVVFSDTGKAEEVVRSFQESLVVEEELVRSNRTLKLVEEGCVIAAKQVFRSGGALGSHWRAPRTDDLPLPSFYDWRDLYPELQLLLDNFHLISKECEKIVVDGWKDWPENHYTDGGAQDWKVFPFAYTFPADDPTQTKFIESTCAACPDTSRLLKQLGPLLRTALFSKLGPHGRISSHRGWADLANHVLRCHLGLVVPPGEGCAIWCDGEINCHHQKDFVVFDDSKLHKAYNESEHTRLVLLIDLARPHDMAKGRAVGGRTPELNNIIEYFS